MQLQTISKFNSVELKPALDSYTQAPSEFPATMLSTLIGPKSDREIATAYLINQKGSAKNYAAAVVACANPDLRTFSFLNSSRHAYEMWEYMTKKGYYPLMPTGASVKLAKHAQV